MNNFHPGSFRSRPTPRFQPTTPNQSGDAIPENSEDSSPRDKPESRSPVVGAGPTSLLPDLSRYTHTVAEASHLMQEQGCKFFSERKVQRLCDQEKFDCYRLQTTENGQPVTKWIINGASLLAYIEKHERKGVAKVSGLASSNQNGEVKAVSETEQDVANIPNDTVPLKDDLATPEQNGDAKVADEVSENVATKPDDIPSPKSESGDAKGFTFDQSEAVKILIENAELRVRIEGRDDIISELRKDKEDYQALFQNEREYNIKLQERTKQLEQDLKEVSIKAWDSMVMMNAKGYRIPERGEKPGSEQPPLRWSSEEDNPQGDSLSFSV